MKTLPRLFLSMILAGSPMVVSNAWANGSTVPAGTSLSNPGEKLTTQATRLPKRDTRTDLVCTAADGAPKLADRMNEGSCRSHTKEHQAENRKSLLPITGSSDFNAITGR